MWGGCLFHPPAFTSCQKVFDCMAGTFHGVKNTRVTFFFRTLEQTWQILILGRTGSGSELQRFITTVSPLSACRSTKFFNEMIKRICDSRSLETLSRPALLLPSLLLVPLELNTFLPKVLVSARKEQNSHHVFLCKRKTKLEPNSSCGMLNDRDWDYEHVLVLTLAMRPSKTNRNDLHNCSAPVSSELLHISSRRDLAALYPGLALGCTPPFPLCRPVAPDCALDVEPKRNLKTASQSRKLAYWKSDFSAIGRQISHWHTRIPPFSGWRWWCCSSP